MKIIVAIKDTAIQAFGPPFMQHTKGEAMRGLDEEVNNGTGQVNKTPEDFELYQLAEYDETAGQLFAAKQPELIVRAKDLKRVKGE